jgi:hypothetical protein
MRKSLTVVLISALSAACMCGLTFAASSEAVEWAGNGYYLASGQNGFLNYKVHLYASDVLATSGQIGCAGIREYNAVVCEEYAGSGAGVVRAEDVYSEPDLHNHGTKGGTFRGFYYS